MLIITTKSKQELRLIATGSLIDTNSKFGHELIAGPLLNNQQMVLHKEQKIGGQIELLENAAQRYNFTEIVEPKSIEYGMQSFERMRQKMGSEWALLDNCQHAARYAFYGQVDSPSINGLAFGLTVIDAVLIANNSDY